MGAPRGITYIYVAVLGFIDALIGVNSMLLRAAPVRTR